MINFEILDVCVISLDPEKPIKPSIKNVFPNARVIKAVDMRTTNPLMMRKSNLITHSAVDTLQHGRKWHKELSSKGAIGIHQSNRVALEYGDGPLLLLEEDCNISPDIQMHLNELMRNDSKFDVAVFGGIIMESNAPLKKVDFLPKGWNTCSDMYFILMHCVFYTPIGRKKMANHLNMPQEIQIDALLSFLNRFSRFR